MQSQLNKLLRTTLFSLAISPLALAAENTPAKPPVQPQEDVMYWDELLPRLDDLAQDYELPLNSILHEYFPEYDGENYVTCVQAEEKHNDRNQNHCDSLSNDFDKKECHEKNNERHERAIGQCHDVGKSENETKKESSSKERSSSTENNIRVGIRDIVFGKKK